MFLIRRRNEINDQNINISRQNNKVIHAILISSSPIFGIVILVSECGLKLAPPRFGIVGTLNPLDSPNEGAL